MLENTTKLHPNQLKSMGHVLWQALIPGVVIWLLLDPVMDLLGLKLNSSITIGYMFLIALAMLIYTLLVTSIGVFLKWHQSEQFIYTTIVMLEFIILYLTSPLQLAILWRFLIALAIAAVGTMVMTMIIAVIRNQKIKD